MRFWWKGQREWVTVETWRTDLKNIVEGFRTNIQTTAWYVEHLGTQKGPMYSRDLQSFIQSNGIVGTCRVWTEGMDRWMNVYEITELVQFFGITRRKHPRALPSLRYQRLRLEIESPLTRLVKWMFK